ncbi:MAG: hypothetical protein MUD11_09075 [Rhodobacteraceae bacterium]|jgi:hypothetical protein|nr:hypothetical protein [Paracoccaceae bacterium]
MRILAILVLLVMAACTAGPQLGIGMNVGPGGVIVTPTVRGNVGGVDVGIAGSGTEL